MFNLTDNKPYAKKVALTAFLTEEEERELLREYKRTGDLEARDKVILSNQKFAIQEAFKYRSKRISAEDLIQEANVGMLHAVQKFDPERGYRFLTYARWWIRATLSKHLYENDAPFKGGTSQVQRKLWFKVIQLVINLTDEGHSEEEAFAIIAKQFGVSVSGVRATYSLRSAKVSEYREVNASPLIGPEALVIKRDLEERVDRLATNACRRDVEKDIIDLYIMSDESVSLQAIGDKHRISRERVRQIKNRLLARIKEAA